MPPKGRLKEGRAKMKVQCYLLNSSPIMQIHIRSTREKGFDLNLQAIF